MFPSGGGDAGGLKLGDPVSFDAYASFTIGPSSNGLSSNPNSSALTACQDSGIFENIESLPMFMQLETVALELLSKTGTPATALDAELAIFLSNAPVLNNTISYFPLTTVTWTIPKTHNVGAKVVPAIQNPNIHCITPSTVNIYGSPGSVTIGNYRRFFVIPTAKEMSSVSQTARYSYRLTMTGNIRRLLVD